MFDVFTGASFDEYKKYLLKSVLTNNQRVKKLYDLIDLEEITVESLLSDSSLSERDFVELIAARRRLGYDKGRKLKLKRNIIKIFVVPLHHSK